MLHSAFSNNHFGRWVPEDPAATATLKKLVKCFKGAASTLLKEHGDLAQLILEVCTMKSHFEVHRGKDERVTDLMTRAARFCMRDEHAGLASVSVRVRLSSHQRVMRCLERAVAPLLKEYGNLAKLEFKVRTSLSFFELQKTCDEQVMDFLARTARLVMCDEHCGLEVVSARVCSEVGSSESQRTGGVKFASQADLISVMEMDDTPEFDEVWKEVAKPTVPDEETTSEAATEVLATAKQAYEVSSAMFRPPFIPGR